MDAEGVGGLAIAGEGLSAAGEGDLAAAGSALLSMPSSAAGAEPTMVKELKSALNSGPSQPSVCGKGVGQRISWR